MEAASPAETEIIWNVSTPLPWLHGIVFQKTEIFISKTYPKVLVYNGVDWIHLKDLTFVSREHGNETV